MKALSRIEAILIVLLVVVSIIAVYEWIRPTPSALTTPTPTEAEKLYYVPILNKWMTYSELVNEIKKEGKITIADWTYGGLIETYHVQRLRTTLRRNMV